MRALTIAILIVALAAATAWRPWKQGREKLECKYDKGEWGDCDPETNLVTRVLTLRNGEEGCQETKNQTISCEKFQKIQESHANKMDRKNKRREERLQREQDKQARKMERKHRRQEAHAQRQQEKQERKERRRLMKEQRRNCKYDKGEWSECDNTTDTVTRVLTLRGTEEGCQPTMEVSISCDKYEHTKARDAKKMDRKNEKRMERLQEKETQNMLKENRKLIREQEKLGCSFEVSYSECDNATQMVTKTHTPVGEDEFCQSTTISYSCQLHERLMERQMKGHERKNHRKNGRSEFKQQRSHHRKSRRS